MSGMTAQGAEPTFSWDPVAGAYFWHRFYSHQPDLNFDNPHVVRAAREGAGGSATKILAVTVLTLAGFLWLGEAFDLWMAFVNGGGLVLGGLWMRRS